MSKSKKPNVRAVNKFRGYYLDDCLCKFCLHNKGPKGGCSLPACMCMDEKLDALMHGRIERKHGSMTWDVNGDQKMHNNVYQIMYRRGRQEAEFSNSVFVI